MVRLGKPWVDTVLISFFLFTLSSFVFLFNFRSYEGLFSSFRILISIIFWPYFLRNVKLINIINVFFFFSLLNALLVILQFYDAVVSDFLPYFLKFGYFYGFEAVEPFRNGGLLNGVQVSSFVAFCSLFIGLWYSKKYPFFWISVNSFVLLTGSRSILILSLPFLFFIFKKHIFVLLALILLFIQAVSVSVSFDEFLVERIFPAIEVVVNLDASKDYSSEDTMDDYRIPLSGLELLFGNGSPRYSDTGGGDPFFSRWLLQSGIIVSVILIFLILYIILGFFKFNFFLGTVVFLLFLVTSIKGELFTSVGVFDFLIISRFTLLPKLRARN